MPRCGQRWAKSSRRIFQGEPIEREIGERWVRREFRVVERLGGKCGGSFRKVPACGAERPGLRPAPLSGLSCSWNLDLAFKLVDPGSMGPDIRGMDHQSRPDSEPLFHRTGRLYNEPIYSAVAPHEFPLRVTFLPALLYAYWAYLAYLQNHHGGVEQRPALEG